MADDVVVQEVCANMLGAVLGLGSWVSDVGVLGLRCWGLGPVSPGGSVTQRGGERAKDGPTWHAGQTVFECEETCPSNFVPVWRRHEEDFV
jgi:hypothetical protein